LKRIEKYAFVSSGLKSIRIPSQVEFIGESCFYKCKSLRKLIFEHECNLKRIEKDAFRHSGLKSIQIPSQVEFIGDFCFYDCKSLTEVIFQGEVEVEIETHAFVECPLKSVKVPIGVKLKYSFCEGCQIESVREQKV
jgi:hypothetical protein